ncbi:MAG: DUF2178 domain-containing protein [Patescibacteria group bacterium]|nr:DUF2178 domain-containing protein [Patescibacteria group bacterium]
MTKKTFLIYKIIAVIVVGIAFGASVNFGNWYLPLAILIAAWVFLYILRTRVKEVIADERDYNLAGKASALSLRIFASLAVIAGFILYVAEKQNETMFAIGSVLMYSAGFLMLLYAIIFKIYEKKDERN